MSSTLLVEGELWFGHRFDFTTLRQKQTHEQRISGLRTISET
jgi:hypothetical protein